MKLIEASTGACIMTRRPIIRDPMTCGFIYRIEVGAETGGKFEEPDILTPSLLGLFGRERCWSLQGFGQFHLTLHATPRISAYYFSCWWNFDYPVPHLLDVIWRPCIQ
jgi:hypothetical protein